MAGEIFRGAWQIGKEVTPGTGVAATRKQYWRPDGSLTVEVDSREHEFLTGTRSNLRQITRGPNRAAGSISQALSSSEAVELFLIGLRGGVTPTQPDSVGAPTVYLWTFNSEGADLDSATIEWHDGARGWRGVGMRANGMTISGAVGEENVLSADLFGIDLTQQAITAALTDRTPDFIEGRQTRLFIDNYGAVPGTTQADLMMNWSVALANNLDRSYVAKNTLAADEVHYGTFRVTGSVTVKASVAAALAEYDNFRNSVGRIVRFQFQDETGFIATTFRRFVTIDVPLKWTTFNIAGTSGNVRTYEAGFSSYYDSTNAYMIQARLQNNRASAY